MKEMITEGKRTGSTPTGEEKTGLTDPEPGLTSLGGREWRRGGRAVGLTPARREERNLANLRSP